ncbi:MAG: membrane protein insertion efficiency factor YidD [Phycisphaerae bacterium]|nr:membrane protein insertion efficiency factor YidD [Phycisphaerae bacterium]
MSESRQGCSCGKSSQCARPGRATRVGIALIRLYQASLGHLIGGQCRFQPSCSHYGLRALEVHGAWRGGWLTVRRIMRCQPWGGSGFDPVPGDSRCESRDDASTSTPS